MIDLSGKTALITGAARRIGRAIALALAQEGANVALHYSASLDDVKRLAAEVEGFGVRAWTVRGDLSVASSASEVFMTALEGAGAVDFLVNNASVFPEGTLDSMTRDELYANLDVNTIAPLLLSRAMRAQGRPGAIVNLLDCMIADYDRKHVAYHLSKRALHSLTRMMAVEFAPSLRVNGVAPGLVLPPAGKDDTYLDSLAHTNPLHRHGRAEDVAAAVLFLLKSDFVTGQVIYVDGGRNLRGSMYG
ncbi:MAG: short-chain dehydrogenase [Candidatus Hydrogenedentota bacterium]